MSKLSSGYAQPLVFPNAFGAFTPQQGGPYTCAGAPVAGTSCVQTVTIGGTPTGGTFTLIFGGIATGSIAWTATDATLASNIATALNNLPNVGASGTVGAVGTGSSGIGSYTITFQNQNANETVPTIMVGQNNMAGTAPTVTVAMTTTGVTGSVRGVLAGTEITDYSGPRQWSNAGSPNAPSWVRSDSYKALVAVTGVTATTGGALGTWQPAEGGPVIIEYVAFLITTVSTGAANISIGQGTSATTSYTNLIAATSVHSETAPYVIDSYTTQIIAATAAESAISPLFVVLPAANFVTITGSATTAGLVGQLFIKYFKY
jgi:hypothetical protein